MKALTKRVISIALSLCLFLNVLPAITMQVEAADSISMMVSYAQARVGKTGQQLGYTDQWCAFFVCDCASYAGQTEAIPRHGNAHNLYFLVLEAGGYEVTAPQKGDLVFYNCTACDTNGDGISMMHVGLVENENYTIEGNLDGSSYLTRTVKRKGINERYSHSSSHSTDNYIRRVFVRPNYSSISSHTCNKGTYVYYEAAHPHYKCYKCSICGSVWRNTAEPTTVSTCTSCVPTKHTIDSSYGTNFTAYPKAKITAENIFNEYHSQIDSTSWIGTSDKCTIHEVYTDGCCKVTYPLDAGGTKTVYSKISLFNTHTHDYTGARVYQSAHPHEITQRCVDYATCGGWKYTGEYYEVKTCEQCWHADFDIGASSVSVKVGESKAVSAVLSGCLPDSAFLDRYFTPDNGVAEVTIQNQQLIFTGLKEGTTSFRMYLYSDSTKSHLLDAVSILVDVTVPTYTVSYNANGGSGAPSSQTKYYNTTLTLSNTKPTRLGYTFLGWSTSSTATSATYQPGGSFTTNANTTLYAAWKANTTALSVNSSNSAVISTSGEMNYFTFTPTTSGKYVIYSTGSDDTKVYLYNASGTELDSDDDDGDGNNFRLEYNLTAGTTYTFGIKYYNSSKTGTISFKFGNIFIVTYNANGGSGAPSAQSKDYGTNITLSTTKPSREGYTFLGWSTSSTATSATYQHGGNYTINSGTTLYAVWKIGCEGGSHSYSYKATKTPTVSATGMLSGTCSKCSGTTTVTLPKLNTTDYSYQVIKAATCTESGTGRYTWKTTTYGSVYCNVTITKLGHSYSYKVTLPTCIEQGYSTFSCEKCGSSYASEYTDAIGHNWSGWSTVTQPSCERTGKQQRTCLNGCGSVVLKTVEVTGHSYIRGVCENCGEPDPDAAPQPILFPAASLKLESDITLYVYVPAADYDSSYSLEFVKTYADGREVTKTVPAADWEAYGSTLYRVGFNGIAAKEMTDDIIITVKNADGKVVSEEFVTTVAEVATWLFDDPTSADVYTLVSDMLNYGAAAQVQFKYHTDELANAVMTEAQKAYASEAFDMDALEDDYSCDIAGGTSLSLETNIQMNFYLDGTVVDNTMTANVSYTDYKGNVKTATVSGSDFAENSGMVVVTVDTLVPADVNVIVTVEIVKADGTVVATVADSMASYCKYMHDGTTEIYRELMEFTTSCYEYFGG